MNPFHTTPEEIKDIITGPEPELQTSMSPDESPLNQPVAEKVPAKNEEPSPFNFPEDEGPEDAPEQVIGNGQPESDQTQQPGIPSDAAMLAAETFIGMFNNVIALGGGYFIRIEKKESFYDVEGFTSMIDAQNNQNIEQIKLDEDDKAMLRPLVAAVIRKHAVQLSVEQQLIGVVLGIIIKKAKAIMVIRSENQVMVSQLEKLIEEGKLKQATNMEKKEPVEAPPVEAVEEVV